MSIVLEFIVTHTPWVKRKALNKDEVIVLAPYWVSYPPIAMLAGATPVTVETREAEDFKVSPEALEEVITPRTKLLILNSPSNLTGSVCAEGELETLAKVVLKHNIWVVSDDIYKKTPFRWQTLPQHRTDQRKAEIKDFCCQRVSKTYAMTGWRIGYVGGLREVIAAMTRIQSQSTSNANSIAQRAAIAALNGPEDFVQDMVQAFEERCKYLTERLNALPGVHCNVPGGAFYAFPNFSHYYKANLQGSSIEGSSGLCGYLLTEARVALVPVDCLWRR